MGEQNLSTQTLSSKTFDRPTNPKKCYITSKLI